MEPHEQGRDACPHCGHTFRARFGVHTAFQSLVAYLEGLPAWDGTTDPIARLAAGVHVKDDQKLFGIYFKKWLVATIASLLDTKVVNHEILVFIGKQGIYKTTWMQRLLPVELQRYFYVKSNSRRVSKDDLLR